MKKQKELIVSLVTKANEVCSNMTIQETSLFFAIFYTLVLLKPKAKRPSTFDINAFDDIRYALNKSFADEYSFFEGVLQTLSKGELQTIYKTLRNASINSDTCDNTVSWLYQSLKKGLEKAAFEKIGKNSHKIKGKDLLYTTQFFTDEYMVKYLVDSCIKENLNHIKNTVFVDPALGGGNFLTYTFVALFNLYRTTTKDSAEDIVRYIISNQLLGYDLDSHLPIIAKLSLYLNIVARAGLIEIGDVFFYGGHKDDILGFMAGDIRSKKLKNLSFKSHLNQITSNPDLRIIYATNPPFMGKRDMELSLKRELLSSYPQCKGDLCFSFMCKIMNNLRENDTVAIVSQNGWLNLSSLKSFREEILDHYYISSCVDLGSNAFYAINGEKTNIVLAIITRSRRDKKSLFYNLRGISYGTKKELLENKDRLSTVLFEVNQEDFRANPSYEFSYELVNSFLSLNQLEQYSAFANPMQGTSTGNNEEFVKFAWEPITASDDWKLVSKGGGFSKWEGLNIYKVKWGKGGELVANNPGSALRNLKEIPFTDLVYSDTGTLGLNVRVLLENQLFIASGPGIRVLRGNKYCHMAFLNSKLATCLLKIKNPKFTISAGYIGKLPVKEEILTSKSIAKQASQALTYKQTLLKNKLPNIEYTYNECGHITDIEEYIDDLIMTDIEIYKQIAILESKIDSKILQLYHFNDVQLKLITAMIGSKPSKSFTQPVTVVDDFIVSAINECCMPVSRKLNGCIVGSDNVLEMLAFEYNSSISSIGLFIQKNIRGLKRVREKYKMDLIHKLILHVCGVDSIDSVSKSISCHDVTNKIMKDYNYLATSLKIDDKLVEMIINQIHCKGFLNKPLLTTK